MSWLFLWAKPELDKCYSEQSWPGTRPEQRLRPPPLPGGDWIWGHVGPDDGSVVGDQMDKKRAHNL